MYHQGERPSDNVLREYEGAGAYVGNTREQGRWNFKTLTFAIFLGT
jgi:hypothetical protein